MLSIQPIILICKVINMITYDFHFKNPHWLAFLSFKCLEELSRIRCSTTLPQFNFRLIFPPILVKGGAFFQSWRTTHKLPWPFQDKWHLCTARNPWTCACSVFPNVPYPNSPPTRLRLFCPALSSAYFHSTSIPLQLTQFCFYLLCACL